MQPEKIRVPVSSSATSNLPAARAPCLRFVAAVTLLLSLALPAAQAADAGPADHARTHDFGGVDAQALALYRRGWIEILEYGRWAEAERLYRETVAAAPDFAVARSVLARIVTDPEERGRLYRQVQSTAGTVDADARLLLSTYQKTLELFARREAGEAIAPDARESMARQAVSDYGAFLEKYPGEWSVMIEYIEWVHALDGPAAALGEIERIRRAHDGEVGFSYFPAWFQAELGHHEKARELAGAFRRRIDDATSPQPHYLDAFVAFSAGDYARAGEAVERALALDPRHLLAGRLQRRIAAARAEADD